MSKIIGRLNPNSQQRLMKQEIIRLGNLYDQHDRWGVIDCHGICSTLTAAMGLGGGHVPLVIRRKDANIQKT